MFRHGAAAAAAHGAGRRRRAQPGRMPEPAAARLQGLRGNPRRHRHLQAADGAAGQARCQAPGQPVPVLRRRHQGRHGRDCAPGPQARPALCQCRAQPDRSRRDRRQVRPGLQGHAQQRRDAPAARARHLRQRPQAAQRPGQQRPGRRRRCSSGCRRRAGSSRTSSSVSTPSCASATPSSSGRKTSSPTANSPCARWCCARSPTNWACTNRPSRA